MNNSNPDILEIKDNHVAGLIFCIIFTLFPLGLMIGVGFIGEGRWILYILTLAGLFFILMWKRDRIIINRALGSIEINKIGIFKSKKESFSTQGLTKIEYGFEYKSGDKSK
jgi:hypothetical protein